MTESEYQEQAIINAALTAQATVDHLQRQGLIFTPLDRCRIKAAFAMADLAMAKQVAGYTEDARLALSNIDVSKITVQVHGAGTDEKTFVGRNQP